MSYKSKVISKEHQRAKERKDSRSGFTQRNYWLSVLVAFVILPVGTLLSMGTEGFNYYLTWASGFSEGWRWTSVIIVALVCNAMVIMFGKGIVDDIQDGVFSGKTYDKLAFAVKLVAFAGVFYWSVSNSLEGAPLLRTYVQESRQPVEGLLTDLTVVNDAYQARRDQQLSLIKSAQNTTWKGNMTRDAIKAMKAAQVELSKIDAQIAKERDGIAAANADIKTEYNQDLARDADKAHTLAGVGQLMMVFGFIILGLWNTGVEDEAGLKGAGAAAGARPASTGGRSIGFGYGAPAISGSAPHGSHPDPTAGVPSHSTARPIGFKTYPTGTASATPSFVEPGAVATRSYGPDEDGVWPVEAVSRLNSYRAYKKEESVYSKRTTASAQESLIKVREGIAYEEAQLAEMGLEIAYQEKPHRAYILKQRN